MFLKKTIITIFIFSIIFLGLSYSSVYAETDARLLDLSAQRTRVEKMKEAIYDLFSFVEMSNQKEFTENVLNELLMMINSISEKIENRTEKIEKIIQEEKKEKEEDAETERIKGNVFRILQELIRERYEKRNKDIKNIEEIIDRHTQLIERTKTEQAIEIENFDACKFFHFSITRDPEKCNSLKDSHKATLNRLENRKIKEINSNWPTWSSLEAKEDIPDMELFKSKEIIKVEGDTVILNSFPKANGGYLLEIPEIDMNFEVLLLADGSYYLKK